MKIAIATGGRFHVLDLARELDALGHRVEFYSYVPRRRAEQFGLPRHCHVALLPFIAPLVMLERAAPTRWEQRLARWKMEALDRVVAWRLQPSDALIAMSGMFLETLKVAKQRYGMIVILERGSRHILSQDRILRDIDDTNRIDTFIVERELAGYEIADYISIPSRHVAESFCEFGVPRSKLLVNPYGCDLDMFPPTVRTATGPRTVLFVGTWSRQKGCDILTEAWRAIPGVRLLHVGPVGDLPLPEDRDFVHVPTVSQDRLSQFYAESDVFVLASHQDGFGMVLSQALASGLPVVCTTMTGGPDLRDMLDCGDAALTVAPGDVIGLTLSIQKALSASSKRQDGRPRVLCGHLEYLSWRRYGLAFDRHLREAAVARNEKTGSGTA
jgi:glycosyltransferase involved in cell wall biosynthesis